MEHELEGQDCGERKRRLWAASRVDLIYRSACHQTAPFSTGYLDDLQESSLEDSSNAALPGAGSSSVGSPSALAHPEQGLSREKAIAGSRFAAEEAHGHRASLDPVAVIDWGLAERGAGEGSHGSRAAKRSAYDSLHLMGQPRPTGDDDVPNELRSLVDQLAMLHAADRERIVRAARRAVREQRRTVSWSHLRDTRGIVHLFGDAVKDTEAL